MVLMNGSKKARNQDSLMNQTNTLGGVKKAGLVSKVGHPANVFFRLQRDTPTPGFFPLAKYVSTVKGTVGMKYPYM
jgi:hypothetical protein